MTYNLRFSGRAEREFLKLSPAIAGRVADAIANLKNNPRPQSCVKLTGSKSEYGIRIGDYRIFTRLQVRPSQSIAYGIEKKHIADLYRNRLELLFPNARVLPLNVLGRRA